MSNMICTVPGCGQVFTNWDDLRLHLAYDHAPDVPEDAQSQPQNTRGGEHMDEARLKEIEGLAADLRPAIAELIAALRDAWRERDFAKDQVLGVVEQRNRDSSEMQHQRERADRAEAEVEKLRALKDLQATDKDTK